jgi:hypothetical protein
LELNGSSDAGVAGSGSLYGGILVTRGIDKFKYRSFMSLGVGAGVFGVSGQIVSMKYYYVGDINNFSLKLFEGSSFDGEISVGEGLIGGAIVSVVRNPEFHNEFLIGLGMFVGAGAGSPVSGSATWQYTTFY